MPWHDDDHKFGEGKEVTQRELEDLLKSFPAPSIDPYIDRFQGRIATVCLVDNGKCYYCGDRAIYAFRSRLYCASCWLELDEDRD